MSNSTKMRTLPLHGGSSSKTIRVRSRPTWQVTLELDEESYYEFLDAVLKAKVTIDNEVLVRRQTESNERTGK